MKDRLESAGVAEDEWHETLTLAALIQREARFEDDFYRASRVFTNRLDVSMPLQSDATITYWTGKYDSVGTS
ncbi:MAG: endolytic transglycosylase MltG, partial [Pontimonas sp.]